MNCVCVCACARASLVAQNLVKNLPLMCEILVQPLGWENPLEEGMASCSVMSNSENPQAAALQVPLSMGFSRQEYWGGLPHPPPRDGPNPGIKPASLLSPALTGRFFTTSATWKALINGNHLFNVFTWPEARERKRLHQLWCFFLFLQGNQSYQIRVPIL